MEALVNVINQFTIARKNLMFLVNQSLWILLEPQSLEILQFIRQVLLVILKLKGLEVEEMAIVFNL